MTALIPMFLYELIHPDGDLRFTSGYNDAQKGGQTFYASAGIIRPSEIRDVSDATASKMDLYVVGSVVSDEEMRRGLTDLIFSRLSEDVIRFAPFNVFVRFFDADTGTQVGSTLTVFSGYVDSTSVDFTNSVGAITAITWEGLSGLSRGYNFTPQHLKLFDATDEFLDFTYKDFIVLGEGV